jgi:membrane protein YqaA with SNARE-associated domain
MQFRWIAGVERFAGHPSAPWLLAAIAFADSSFLPIPPDILLIPMALVRPQLLWPLSILCTVAAGVGALVGYGIGALLWQVVGQPLVDLYGWADGFDGFQAVFNEWGVWVIIFKAFTPLPFKFAAIAAGLADMDVWVFLAAATASRALHFVMVALLLLWLGPRLQEMLRKYESRAAVVGMVAVAATVLYVGLR